MSLHFKLVLRTVFDRVIFKVLFVSLTLLFVVLFLNSLQIPDKDLRISLHHHGMRLYKCVFPP